MRIRRVAGVGRPATGRKLPGDGRRPMQRNVFNRWWKTQRSAALARDENRKWS